jgi:hypothetical protein
MIDGRRISRRTVLRGIGASLALPFLEAMEAPLAWAAPAARPPVRLGFVFVPNGIAPSGWMPARGAVAAALAPTLEPLAPVVGETLVLSGLALDGARAKNDGPGDHARSAAAFLTTAHPFKTEGRNIKIGVSVDQVAARAIGAKTALPSLELGCDRGNNTGNCDSGYSCAYSNNISWSSETTPMPKEIDPRAVFERLFGAPGETEEVGARRLRDRRSVLDLVAEEAKRLEKELGSDDRRKLDEYQASVREVERRIERAEKEARDRPPRPALAEPAGIPHDHGEHVRLLYDLMALGFQADLTRVATFMVAPESSGRSYPWIGVSEGHHELSHHSGDKAKIEKIEKIDRWNVEQFAYFVEKLKSIKEGPGTLLDSCAIVYGSGICDGNAHNHEDLPILVAGRGGGTIATGRRVACPRNAPLANLYLALLQRAGVRADKFGDSTAALAQLAA